MPHAIAPAVRYAIVQRHHQGHATTQIALDLELCQRSVRHLLQAFRTHGSSTLQPRYAACGARADHDHDPLYRQALWLRGQHPRWGAGRLRLQLAKLSPERPLPS